MLAGQRPTSGTAPGFGSAVPDLGRRDARFSARLRLTAPIWQVLGVNRRNTQ
jgi:hypothetical protein